MNGLVGGDIPPYDYEAESSVLGAVLIAPAWLDSDEVWTLEADDFYRPRNRLIWRAVKSLHATADAIDWLTVAARLEMKGKLEEAGGKDYIETLLTHIPDIGNTKGYAKIIRETSMLRTLLAAGYEIQRLVNDRAGDPEELIDKALNLVGRISVPANQKAFGPDALMQMAVDHLTREKPVETFPLPYPKLNEACNGGLRRGQVVVLAGFPNDGKSLVGMDFLESGVDGSTGKAKIYLTEMTVEELNHRVIARNSKLTIGEVIRGNIGYEQMNKLGEFKIPNVEIQPASGWTVDQICHDILRSRPDVVMVDHFHRINLAGNRNKVDAYDEASAKLNSVAKDNQANCVMIIVAHLSRPGTDKEAIPPRPNSSHLRGTQMLEADADIVCMVYRERDKLTGNRQPAAEAYFTRSRSGRIASEQLLLDEKHLRFYPEPEL